MARGFECDRFELAWPADDAGVPVDGISTKDGQTLLNLTAVRGQGARASGPERSHGPDRPKDDRGGGWTVGADRTDAGVQSLESGRAGPLIAAGADPNLRAI